MSGGAYQNRRVHDCIYLQNISGDAAEKGSTCGEKFEKPTVRGALWRSEVAPASLFRSVVSSARRELRNSSNASYSQISTFSEKIKRLWKSCVGRRSANDPSSPPLSLIEAFFSKEQRKHFFHCSNFVAASTVSSRNPQARGVASRRIPRAGAERDTIKFDDRRDDQHPGCGR